MPAADLYAPQGRTSPHAVAATVRTSEGWRDWWQVRDGAGGWLCYVPTAEEAALTVDALLTDLDTSNPTSTTEEAPYGR